MQTSHTKLNTILPDKHQTEKRKSNNASIKNKTKINMFMQPLTKHSNPTMPALQTKAKPILQTTIKQTNKTIQQFMLANKPKTIIPDNNLKK